MTITKRSMKVNFNNARRMALSRYDQLVETLNSAIIKNDDQYCQPNGWNHETNLKDFVVIDSDELKDILDSMRQLLGTIAMTFEEDNEDFVDVWEQSYPGDKSMAIFKDEDED